MSCLIIMITFITISCSEDEKEPEIPEPTFEGRYIGGWWSNAANGSVYVNLPISATIDNQEGDRWFGQFFYTEDFTSCCSNNANDGSISFMLKDSIITEFVYSGTLPNCDGLFQGEGVLTQSGAIEIDLTGQDCEGTHSDARIRLSK